MAVDQIKMTTGQARAGTRERVLAAAERLLGEGEAAFSMRDLATEADVSFATPFNLFGSKLGIMRELSAQRIEHMRKCAIAEPRSPDLVARILDTVRIAARVMVEQPAVNKAVMAAIGAPGSDVGEVRLRSQSLWAEAVGEGDGFPPEHRDVAVRVLPDQLAIAFRGVLSFWTAGEIADAALLGAAVKAATIVLLGFVDDARREALIAVISA